MRPQMSDKKFEALMETVQVICFMLFIFACFFMGSGK